jgi:hypothetical protein
VGEVRGLVKFLIVCYMNTRLRFLWITHVRDIFFSTRAMPGFEVEKIKKKRVVLFVISNS